MGKRLIMLMGRYGVATIAFAYLLGAALVRLLVPQGSWLMSILGFVLPSIAVVCLLVVAFLPRRPTVLVPEAAPDTGARAGESRMELALLLAQLRDAFDSYIGPLQRENAEVRVELVRVNGAIDRLRRSNNISQALAVIAGIVGSLLISYIHF